MPRFSLRQILVAMAVLAVGFSIVRLPGGRWYDVPLLVLSFYFVVSLWREAAATRRRLAARANLPREQLWGGRIFVVALVGTATVLVGSWIYTFLAAGNLVPESWQDDDLVFGWLLTTPEDVTVLSLLAAVGLGTWRLPHRATPLRQRVFSALAAVAALILLLVAWAEKTLLWFLVYIAVSGVEAAQPSHFLSPELNESTFLRMQRFAAGGVIGLSLAVANVLLIAALVAWWRKARLRLPLLVLLTAGLAAEGAAAVWIGGPGLRQLSPPMQEAVRFPPLAPALLGGTMVGLAAGAFAWRLLAKPASLDASVPVVARPSYLHEHWLGCLLLGIVAAAGTAIATIILVNEPPAWHTRFDWQWVTYALIYRPAAYIWLAAIIGGFALAWVHWNRRKQPAEELLPSVDPAQFAVLMASLLIAVIAAAPIVAAVSVSYWFIYAGML